MEAVWCDLAGEQGDQTDSRFIPLSPYLSSFLSILLAICQTLDPFTHSPQVEIEFDRIMNEWKGKEEPTLRTPESYTKRPNEDEVLSKNQFTVWATASRRRQMCQLLRLLQLRSILMYFFMLCNHDSMAICESEGREIVVFIA